MRKLFIISFVSMVICSLMIMATHDYDNKYNINDKTYHYFVLAEENVEEEISLNYADSALQAAIDAKDAKGRVLALLARYKYWVKRVLTNEDDLIRTGEEVKAAALSTNYLQYYFYIYIQNIITYITIHQPEKALSQATEMNREANKYNHDYGRYASFSSMADIYSMLGDREREIFYLYKAVELAPLVHTKAYTGSVFSRLMLLIKDPAEKKRLQQQGLELAISKNDTISIYSSVLIEHYNNKDRKKFEELYNQIFRDSKNLKYINRAKSNQIRRQYLTITNQKEAAIRFIDSLYLNNKENCYNLKQNAYAYWKDFKQAFYYHIRCDSIIKERKKNSYFENIGKFKANIARDTLQARELKQAQLKDQAEARKAEAEALHIKAEAEAIKAQNQQASALAAQQTEKSKAEMLRLQAKQEANMAKDAKTKAQSAQLQSQIASKKAQQANLRKQESQTNLFIGLIVLLAIICTVWFFALHKRMNQIRRLNRKLEEANQDINEANQKKDLFIQNMSHELRTPLNAVMGLSQILTCPGLPVTEEEKREYSSDIINNTSMLTMLIDDMVKVSEFEHGSYLMTLQDYEIKSICEAALSVVQYRVPNGVEMIFSNLLPDHFTCVTDPNRTQQVLTNYLTNACKHTTRGSITLQATIDHNPGHLTFSVTDTGTGIPADQAHNIFERFTKLDDFVQGTGLGLNICHTIAEKLEGRVWLDEDYTNGARFYFEIPTNLQPTNL